jgi:hypothetical protein
MIPMILVRDERTRPVMPLAFPRYASRPVIITVAVLVCAMSGCGGHSRDIVGKWRMSQDATATAWEFSKNGSVLIGNTRGKYTFGDNNRVKIETPFATSVYQMEFGGDRMILREPNGSKLEFIKIRPR